MNQVSVFSLNKSYQPLAKPVAKIVRSVLTIFSRLPISRHKQDFQAEIFLVSDAKIKILNRVFRHKDKTTNVLAFPAAGFSRPDLKGDFLGEIYLAPTYVKARDQNLSRLVIHGLTHLFGYDHNKKNDRIKMELLEEKIFKQLAK